MRELKLTGIRVRFGRHVEALRGVDCTLRAGEVLMLAGPNGAGKSTLLRVVLGLVRQRAGTLWVDGKEHAVDNAFKRDIAYLPEAVAFAENLSGRQVMRFFARARGVPRAQVDAVLARVGLAKAARRAVRGYSRGMRQRLGLGIAILGNAPLLILDEPTGGLDQEGLTVLWSVLEEWRDAGRMVLLSSHDLTLLERRVDRICILRQGEVVADAPPDDLRKIAALPVRVSFGLNGAPDQVDAFEGALAAWEPGRQVSRDGETLRVQVDPSALLGLMDLRAGYPNAVGRLRVEEPGLDQIYERLLQGGSD